MDPSLLNYVRQLQQQSHALPESADVARPAAAPAASGGQSGSAAAEEPARVQTFLDIASRALEWLWPTVIPLGKITSLDGAANLGKSILLLDLAARVSTSGIMPDGSQGRAGKVIIMSAQDSSADTIRPRLEAAGADLGRIINLSSIDGDKQRRPPVFPADLAHLSSVIAQHDVKLCIIDPLTAFLLGIRASKALYRLGKIAEDRHCAIVSTGAGGNLGPARAELVVAADPDDDQVRILSAQRSNLAVKAQPLQFKLEPVGAVCRIAWQGARVEAGNKLQMATDLLASLLAMGPMRARDCKKIAGDGGYSSSTVERAARKLGVTVSHHVEDGSHLFLWAMPVSQHEEILTPLESSEKIPQKLDELDEESEKPWPANDL